MERGLPSTRAFRPKADSPAGGLGGAPDLVSLREPTAPLDLVPKTILQRTAPETRSCRIRRRLRGAISATAVHAAFAAAFLALLTWRQTPAPTAEPPEKPIDVKIDLAPPTSEPPKPEPPKPEPPKPEAPKSLAQMIPQPPPIPAPDPNPPAPPAVQPPPSGVTTPNALLAPPPEPARAKTQAQTAQSPNLAPDQSELPKATHEAKPAEAPDVLSTTNPAASFAVPPPDVPKPPQARPAPEAPRTPSETEKLAAALPMDTSTMPASFRAVLSGNGAAVDAAYKGLVYGRFSHAPEIGERARAQHLKGQVIVAFSIGDDGRLTSLAVLQSSGSPAVDALGMEMIRAAAPFPPPPAGAQRSFTPVLSFGE